MLLITRIRSFSFKLKTLLMNVFVNLVNRSSMMNLYLPIFLVLSVYLPVGPELRSDFFIVPFLFGITLMAILGKGKVLHIDKSILWISLYIVAHFVSTFSFIAFSYDSASTLNFASFTEMQYWFRMIMIIIVMRNISYNTLAFEKAFKYFFYVAIAILALGVLESMRVFPKFYETFMDQFFFSDKFENMRKSLVQSYVRKATSTLCSPSIFAYFCMFILWITLKYPKRLIPFIPRFALIIFLFVAGFASDSKIFYVGLLAIFFYEEVVIKKRLQYFLIFIALFVLIVVYLFTADEQSLPVFARNIVMRIKVVNSIGLYDVFFKTRFDSSTGLLHNNVVLFQENWLLGTGMNRIDGIFYGDSFLLTNLLKVGVLGFSVFVFLMVNLFRRLNNVYKTEEDPLLKTMAYVLRNFIILNFLFSIGIDSFTLTRVSDMMFALIFIVLYMSASREKNRSASITSHA